jgi:hypothetical protein
MKTRDPDWNLLKIPVDFHRELTLSILQILSVLYETRPCQTLL